MKKILTAVFILVSLQTFSQRQQKFVSLAITTNHTAYPFASFGKLFVKDFHPGIEAGYGFNWKTKPKHDWYQTFKGGYFYHRFVQHAIPLYTQFGYRYKWKDHLQLTSAVGGGYLHSIPATAVLKADNDGTYKNAKGIGRGQALINLSFGAQYMIKKNDRVLFTPFVNYVQQLQTPFIKSYVPLLPYNSLQLGINIPVKK